MLAAAAIAHHRDARASSDRRDSGRGARGGARLGRHRCWGRRREGGRHMVCRRGWACLSYLHRCAPGTRRIPCRLPLFRCSRRRNCVWGPARLRTPTYEGATTLLLLMATSTKTNEEEVRPTGDRPWLRKDTLVQRRHCCTFG